MIGGYLVRLPWCTGNLDESFSLNIDLPGAYCTGKGLMATGVRAQRVQFLLDGQELASIDQWRFRRRIPTRAAAVRELLRRGLSTDGIALTAQRDDGSTE
jgi:hypothetical protein